MLVLTRKADQGVIINGDIVVTVLEVVGERVKLGIDAPRTVSVVRRELVDEVRRQNLAAARSRHVLSPGVLEALRQVLGRTARSPSP